MISERRENVFVLEKGFAPRLLTNVLNPVFEKYSRDTSKFYSTDACISCGKCEKVCNSNIITLVKGRPQWSGECSQCLACIHHCPKKAIQYGKSTVKKGRYTNPYFK
jgi:MinD superfamily P-loop ATPase